MSTLPKRSGSNCSFSKGPDVINVKRFQEEPHNLEGNRLSFAGSIRSVVTTHRQSTDIGFEDSCALRHFSKHKSSHLRFLAWVAYTRKYANETITDEERRTCPLLWCREKFVDQEAMLKHVWNCPELSKGLYWCFPCARSERLGKVHKRCQRIPSRTDRLATVAKKIFSKLGAGNHRKAFNNLSVGDHSASSDTWGSNGLSSSKGSRSHGDPMNLDHQIQELPDTSTRAEMAGDWTAACQELADTSILEMMGSECIRESGNDADICSDNFYAETFDDYAPASIAVKDKSLTPNLPRLNTTMMPSNVSMEWTNSAQRFEQVSPTSWSDGSYTSHIVSPMSAVERFGGNFDFEISPTDSEASGNSFFSDSGYTSASTQSIFGFSTGNFSRLPSFNNSMGTKRTRDCPNIAEKYLSVDLPTTAPVLFPVSMPRFDQALTQSMNSSTSVSRSSSTASEKYRAKGFSPHWSDKSTLVDCFSEVLEAHMLHSRDALELMPLNPVISELLNMSMTSMISIGSDAVAGIFENRYPTTVAQIYSATHFACACAIVLGHQSDQLHSMEWFSETLQWASGIAAETHRELYAQIATSIWHPSPGVNNNGPESLISTNDHNGHLLKACGKFLDFFENFDNEQKASLGLSSPNPRFDFAQLSFEFKAKSRVIDKLITMNTIEAFITDVVGVEKRLQKGHISNTRILELELLCAGKLSSQSSAAYNRFVDHVTSLCNELYAEQPRTETSRTQHYLRDISLLKEYLLTQRCASHVLEREDDPMDGFTDEQLLFGIDFDFKAASEEVAAEVFAFSKEADDILEHESTSNNFLGPSIPTPLPARLPRTPSSASSTSYPKLAPQPWTSTPQTPAAPTPNNQIPQAQVAKPAATTAYRCHCGYIPTGEEKWKASNLRRHKRVQHAADDTSKKVYRCRWSGCKSVFTRSDNLRSHQRDKGHVLGVGVSLKLGASVIGNGDHDEEDDGEEGDEENVIATNGSGKNQRAKKRRLAGEKGQTGDSNVDIDVNEEAQ